MAIRIGMVQLGCSKNRVDGEIMLGTLRDRGCEIVSDPAQADVVIVNTCGFIESAKQESIDAILEAAQYKKTGRLKKLLVSGCLSQRYPRELSEGLPEVDAFIGVNGFDQLNGVLDDMLAGARPVCMEQGQRFPSTSRILTQSPFSAYVKISDGCDNRCTYCAIPLIRGGYSSRPYDDILRECRELAARGVTELTFIAQDTSRYGSDFEGRPLLLRKLLSDASRIEGIRWLRVLYCYPDTVDEALIKEISENPKICSYLDLPLQHINDGLLRRMNRRGSSEHIKALLDLCRKYGITVRTTMIVGFPGETDAQFEELLSFVKEQRFDRLGAFAYSPEDGTPAAEMPDQLDEETKQARLDALMMAQQAISLEKNTARVGQAYLTLVEGGQNGEYTGRSMLEAPESDGIITFRSGRELKAGDYVRVRITDCDAYDLMGVIE
ncbi:MAG: 30S ribosomal protein S12 methylthiotransferase RimO [Clostridia bacterium]|nr:30S ribosomal protein S12 methylthiotransferase RimO [Clostridia bacterium]